MHKCSNSLWKSTQFTPLLDLHIHLMTLELAGHSLQLRLASFLINTSSCLCFPGRAHFPNCLTLEQKHHCKHSAIGERK
jgi:hypothetical protein